MSGTWTQPFQVRAYETDVGGRLAVTSLCDYCQEAAGVHSVRLGISIGDLGRSNLTWVLGRLELRVERLPRWRDALTVTTWPSGRRSFFVLRDFLIEDARGEILARATSTWFVIDVARRKPARMPEVVRDLTLPPRARALTESWSKLPTPATPHCTARFAVRNGDLDANAHVNHVKYVGWALETLELDFHRRHRLTELTIDFLSECGHGDRVVSEAEIVEQDGSSIVVASIHDETKGVEAARVRSVWLADPGA